MGVIFGLIIISLLLAFVFLISFMMAVRNGQFDDDHTPSVRVLFDDKISQNPTSQN
ncbi:MAG: cbb3-type cytochrome oxidase assembly protein CcoS [Candidatus Competibacteraceae bacterium]|nr:cbb3-type cytochrome oxidase assembly protein CcoS [Candidatus Competibacteraceae bacterium]